MIYRSLARESPSYRSEEPDQIAEMMLISRDIREFETEATESIFREALARAGQHRQMLRPKMIILEQYNAELVEDCATLQNPTMPQPTLTTSVIAHIWEAMDNAYIHVRENPVGLWMDPLMEQLEHLDSYVQRGRDLIRRELYQNHGPIEPRFNRRQNNMNIWRWAGILDDFMHGLKTYTRDWDQIINRMEQSPKAPK